MDAPGDEPPPLVPGTPRGAAQQPTEQAVDETTRFVKTSSTRLPDVMRVETAAYKEAAARRMTIDPVEPVPGALNVDATRDALERARVTEGLMWQIYHMRVHCSIRKLDERMEWERAHRALTRAMCEHARVSEAAALERECAAAKARHDDGDSGDSDDTDDDMPGPAPALVYTLAEDLIKARRAYDARTDTYERQWVRRLHGWLLNEVATTGAVGTGTYRESSTQEMPPKKQWPVIARYLAAGGIRAHWYELCERGEVVSRRIAFTWDDEEADGLTIVD
jgi:hypothetical protein